MQLDAEHCQRRRQAAAAKQHLKGLNRSVPPHLRSLPAMPRHRMSRAGALPAPGEFLRRSGNLGAGPPTGTDGATPVRAARSRGLILGDPVFFGTFNPPSGTRTLDLQTQETQEILHFHYTTWPDFGVPESPASFLNFPFKVWESGSPSPGHGPVVVHCSAGIGRSGTFCLVDTCLLLMDKRKDPSSVDVKQVLLEMRKYRMGLIQTADQLRFSYLAVTEGAKFIMGDASVQVQRKAEEFSVSSSRRPQVPAKTSPHSAVTPPRAERA
ncbi:tyrosine-protein phosphatase non-receptor type 1-like [Aphelocoma coerulescens]|uniref:tyrosine-protein phosphatase non-receptor type 1-like n=1 Tax=Aphelocoma coerulescens TaxID=39617 RepID=UPI003604EE9A